MLQSTIPSYLYTQYADDSDLQAFVTAYNDATQEYVEWFNAVGLPFYPGLTGPLLDWCAEGIYGLGRTALQSQANTALGPLNTEVLNSATLDSFIAPSSTFYSLSDDIFQRILTWDFYKADGKRFSMRWLKRRIMRFLLGANGLDPLPNQPGFSIGTENTTAISTSVISIAGVLTLTVNINQSRLSSLVTLQPGVLNLFQLAFLGGVLELPLQYNYVLNIVTSLAVSIMPTVVTSIGPSGPQSTPLANSVVVGGSGPYTYMWTWKSGGAGINIDLPTAAATTFSASPASLQTLSGVAECTVTDFLGNISAALVQVIITANT